MRVSLETILAPQVHCIWNMIWMFLPLNIWMRWSKNRILYILGSFRLLSHCIQVRLSGSQESNILIEGDILTHLDLSLTRNIYVIGFWCLVVSNKDTLLSKRVHLCSLLFRHMNINCTVENPQMSNVWFLTGEDFFKSLVIQYGMIASVLNIYSSTSSFCP